MKKSIFFLLVLPFYLSAAINEVPMGTKGNQFLYTVSNSTSKTIRKPIVFVASTPSWLTFETSMAVEDSIPAGGSRDFQLKFDVENGESGRAGLVKLIVLDSAGTFHSIKTVSFKTGLSMKKTALLTPYPNPANPSTTVRFALLEPSFVFIHIFNVLGQSIRTLMNEIKPAGQWECLWDGRNDQGLPAPSGIYIVQLSIHQKGEIQYFKSKITIER
jgi:hypothetical protein